MDNEAHEPELDDQEFREIMYNVEELWRPIAETIDKTFFALEKVELVGSYGWMIPMHSGLGEIASLYELISDQNTADTAFEKYFNDFDSQNLDILTKSLLQKDELELWKPLLIEVVDSLHAERYRIVVSALLPVIEGVCAVNFGKLKFYKGKEREEFLKEIRLWAKRNESFTAYMWLSAIGLLNMVYKTADLEGTSETDGDDLNRHRILHGRRIPKANRLDAIKLLLALDTISALNYPTPAFSR